MTDAIEDIVKDVVYEVQGAEYSQYLSILTALQDGIDDIVIAVMGTSERDTAHEWLHHHLTCNREDPILAGVRRAALQRRSDATEDSIVSALRVLGTPAARATLTRSDVQALAHTCWSDEGIRVFAQTRADLAPLKQALRTLERETQNATSWKLMEAVVLDFLVHATHENRHAVLQVLRHRRTLNTIARDLAARTNDVQLEPIVRYLLYERRDELDEQSASDLQVYLVNVYAPNDDPLPVVMRPSRDSFRAHSAQLESRKRPRRSR